MSRFNGSIVINFSPVSLEILDESEEGSTIELRTRRSAFMARAFVTIKKDISKRAPAGVLLWTRISRSKKAETLRVRLSTSSAAESIARALETSGLPIKRVEKSEEE